MFENINDEKLLDNSRCVWEVWRGWARNREDDERGDGSGALGNGSS